MLAWLMTIADPTFFFNISKSNSKPTRNIKKISPSWLTRRRLPKEASGKRKTLISLPIAPRDASEKINYDTRYGHIIGLDKMYLAVHNGCYMKEKISTVKAVFVESRFRNLVRLFAPTPF
jgi:hypothetical protein